MAEIKDIHGSPGAQNAQLDIHLAGITPATDGNPLQLAGILQSTLDLNKLLELFAAEISRIAPHDGLSYGNHEQGCSIELGEQARHRCSYQLLLQENRLGELIFYRHNRFNDTEIRQLETMVAALIYPLRNALLYKKAVDNAHTDPVTGISNRSAMDGSLPQEINLANRYATALSIIMIDIDKFKHINDTYGHIAGDAVLRSVAQSMSNSIRGSDFIYRYGGEEFLILLRNTDISGAELLAQRIRKRVESMNINYNEFDIHITISAGVASLGNGDTEKELLQRGDTALYRAKESGRNCVVVADA